MLAGKDAGESEQLVGKLRGSDGSAAYLDIHALADRLHGRYPCGPFRGNPCRDQNRDQCNDRSNDDSLPRYADPHGNVHTDNGEKFISDQEERYADTADAHQNAQWDTDNADRQRLKQHHSSKLLSGGAHRGQQAELPCPLRDGDGERVIDERYGAEHNQRDDDGGKTVKRGKKGIKAGCAGIQQDLCIVGIAILLRIAHFLHEVIHSGGLVQLEITMDRRLFGGFGVRCRKRCVPGSGVVLKGRSFIDTDHCVGSRFGVFEPFAAYDFRMRFAVIGVYGRVLSQSPAVKRPVPHIKRDGVTERIIHLAV